MVPGDNLWDIAQEELGDPQLWREIYALNRGRPQPDGRHLTDPALIYPGWVLLLPARPGPPQLHHEPPRHPASPPAAGHAHAGRHRYRPPGPHPPGPAPRGGSTGNSTPHPGGTTPRRGGTTGIHLPGGGLAGAALAAAVSAALVLAAAQRSRRYRPAATITSSLQPGQRPLPAAIAALRRAASPRPHRYQARTLARARRASFPRRRPGAGTRHRPRPPAPRVQRCPGQRRRGRSSWASVTGARCPRT